MARCANCTLQLLDDRELCPHHHIVYGDNWAAVNRIMCDFLHRRVDPKRVPHEALQLKVILALGAAGLYHISVDMEEDEVRLEGRVGSPEERKRAERIAASVHGVKRIVNFLQH